MMNPVSGVLLELLSKDNYELWKIQMKAVLVKNGFWKYVNGTIKCPEIASGGASSDLIIKREAWLEADEKAKAEIILSISPPELKLIKNCETSREIWLKLEQIYESKEPSRKAALLKRLMLLKMADDGDVREHCKQFFDIVDKLEEIEIKINEDLLSIMFLCSLPETLKNFRCSIETREELPKLDTLRVKVIEEVDMRRRDLTLKDQREFIVTSTFIPPQDGDNQSETIFGNRSSEINQINTSLWYLDSVCTLHLCNNINKIQNLKNGAELLKFPNRQPIEIEGSGSVSLRIIINNKLSSIDVKEVFYAPKIKMNVLSISKITDKGFRVEFDKNEAKVKDEFGNIILTARRFGGLYCVKDIEKAANSVKVSKGNLFQWHQKLGHLNFHSMRNLCDRGILSGLNPNELRENMECEICLVGKMSDAVFSKRFENRTSRVLEIVHSDIYGPMTRESNGGSRYFVTFTDEHSRWTEVYFLKNRSDVFKTFKDYHSKVENMCGNRIKYLQSSNGNEYINKNFNEFLFEQGIQRLTVTHTCQQNLLSERKNQSLTEMARCMLIQSGLPGSFWAEAVNTANYIRNRCPSFSLNGKTPFDVFFGRPSSVGYFQIFGNVGYTISEDSGRGNFASKSEKSVFIGYQTDTKGYKMYNLKRKTFEMVRNIKFLNQMYKESEFYNEESEDYCILDPLNDYKENENSKEERREEEEASAREISGVAAESRKAGRPKLSRIGGRGRPRPRRC